MENNLIKNQEKVETSKSVKIIQDSLNDNQLQPTNFLKSVKESDSINLDSDKMKMFNDILLQLDNTSYEENKALSGLYNYFYYY